MSRVRPAVYLVSAGAAGFLGYSAYQQTRKTNASINKNHSHVANAKGSNERDPTQNIRQNIDDAGTLGPSVDSNSWSQSQKAKFGTWSPDAVKKDIDFKVQSETDNIKRQIDAAKERALKDYSSVTDTDQRKKLEEHFDRLYQENVSKVKTSFEDLKVKATTNFDSFSAEKLGAELDKAVADAEKNVKSQLDNASSYLKDNLEDVLNKGLDGADKAVSDAKKKVKGWFN